MPNRVNKSQVLAGIRDVREALRQAERALADNDWQAVIECMDGWAAPSSVQVASEIADALGIDI